MKVVWKYEHPLNKSSTRWLWNIPLGAKFLTCKDQYGTGEIMAWFEIPEQEAPKVTRRFQIYGTGHPGIDSWMSYLGTTFHTGGSLVLHLYEDSRITA